MSDPRRPPGGHFGGVGNDVGALKEAIFIRPTKVGRIMEWRRPSSVVFRLTRAQVHISLQINLILSIRVYDHKTLNEFDNHHDPIQNGRPAAILFFSVDTRSSPHFSTNQPRILHTGISIPSAE